MQRIRAERELRPPLREYKICTGDIREGDVVDIDSRSAPIQLRDGDPTREDGSRLCDVLVLKHAGKT